MLGRWTVIAVLMIGIAASVLRADLPAAKPGVVKNKQGQTFKGDVQDDGTYVYITSAGETTKLDRRNVESIDYDKTIDEQYEERHAKLGDKDVKGRIALAQWANANQRADLAVKALSEARQIDPFDKEAGRALESAQKQLDLDLAAAKAKPPAPGATTEPAKGGGPSTQPIQPPQPVAPVPTAAPLERRLLTEEEINIIRQREMKPDDPRIKVKFDPGLVKKYLATGDRDAAAFNKLTPQGQAIEILSNGDPSMAKGVHIQTDPAPLMEFKTKVYPLIVSGCGSTSCHGGMKAGRLAFFPGDGTPALYTNFYILQTYSTTVDGVKYQLMDRDLPSHSLALQFGLPAAVASPPHPKVPGYRPRFKSDADQPYTEIFDWLSKSLQLPQPDYGIKVGARLPEAQPAGGIPAIPPR